MIYIFKWYLKINSEPEKGLQQDKGHVGFFPFIRMYSLNS